LIGECGTDGFGSAGFGASGADEVENRFGGFGEVGVGGEFSVLLRFFYGSQQSTAVTALERNACH